MKTDLKKEKKRHSCENIRKKKINVKRFEKNPEFLMKKISTLFKLVII